MAGAHTATRTEQSATSWENLVTLLGGLWLTAGLFIDGYAHANIIDTATEDFFTPWHGIFYSGFTFSAGWITYLMYRRQNPNGMRSWIPPGYGWAVVGLGVFAVGGIGDLLWHQTFGVETGLDALLSPTHIFLFCGLVLILAAPLQAVRRTGGSLWMAVASMTMLSLLAAFFTTYARPDAWTLEIAAIENSTWASWAIASIIVTTLLMGASALYLLQRFRSLPFGFLTTLWAVPAIGEAFALGAPGAPPSPAESWPAWSGTCCCAPCQVHGDDAPVSHFRSERWPGGRPGRSSATSSPTSSGLRSKFGPARSFFQAS